MYPATQHKAATKNAIAAQKRRAKRDAANATTAGAAVTLSPSNPTVIQEAVDHISLLFLFD